MGAIVNQAVVTASATDPTTTNNTSQGTTTAIDMTVPTVTWVLPVTNKERYDIGKGMVVLLRVNASDNIGIGHVSFSYFDYRLQQTVLIGDDYSPPYEWNFNTIVLNPHFNQINAVAYDTSGNKSVFLVDQSYIWLYVQDFRIFLPMISRK